MLMSYDTKIYEAFLVIMKKEALEYKPDKNYCKTAIDHFALCLNFVVLYHFIWMQAT